MTFIDPRMAPRGFQPPWWAMTNNVAQGVEQPAFPTPPPPQSLWQRIQGNIFPDASGGLLGEEALGGLRRQGLLEAGLAMLANSGESTEKRGLGQILAQGLQQGRQSYMGGLVGALQQQQVMAEMAAQRKKALALETVAEKFKPIEGETAAQRRERLAGLVSELIRIDPENAGKYNTLGGLFDAPKETGPKNIDPRSPEGIAAEKALIDYRAAAEARAARGNSIIITDKNGVQYGYNKGTGELTPLTDPKTGDPLEKFDAARVKSSRANRAAINAVDAAIELVDANPQAFGLEKGRGLPLVSGVVDSRVDPKGVEARAAVANISSLKLHDRSGAVITAAEFPRLQPFIPAIGDPPAVVKTKLRQFRAEYERVQQELEEGKPLSQLLGKGAGVMGGSSTTAPRNLDRYFK